jgi:hypothetical protein
LRRLLLQFNEQDGGILNWRLVQFDELISGDSDSGSPKYRTGVPKYRTGVSLEMEIAPSAESQNEKSIAPPSYE